MHHSEREHVWVCTGDGKTILHKVVHFRKVAVWVRWEKHGWLSMEMMHMRWTKSVYIAEDGIKQRKRISKDKVGFFTTKWGEERIRERMVERGLVVAVMVVVEGSISPTTVSSGWHLARFGWGPDTMYIIYLTVVELGRD